MWVDPCVTDLLVGLLQLISMFQRLCRCVAPMAAHGRPQVARQTRVALFSSDADLGTVPCNIFKGASGDTHPFRNFVNDDLAYCSWHGPGDSAGCRVPGMVVAV